MRLIKKGGRTDTLSPTTPLSEDPLRILAPAQKKLSTIESQRVLGVIDETMKRLEGVSTLSQLVGSIDRLSVSLGSELVLLLEEYKSLVAQYNALYLAMNPTGSSTTVDSASISRLARESFSVGSPNSISRLARESFSFGSPLGSRTSLGSGEGSLHGRLEPLEAVNSEEMTEERLVALGDRLRHVVRCILRGLKENPSISPLLHSVGTSKSSVALMGAMRWVKSTHFTANKLHIHIICRTDISISTNMFIVSLVIFEGLSMSGS